MQNGLPHKDANFLVNRTEQKVLRRELRTCGTSAEAAMWRMLKSRQVENVKFRRQFGVGAYVIDFYSPELRLGIESASALPAFGQRNASPLEMMSISVVTVLLWTTTLILLTTCSAEDLTRKKWGG